MLVETIHLDPKNPDVTLTTYILEDSPELLEGKKRPAVIICPGGAYLNLTDKEAEPIALRFAAMGYHAFVLRYHVYLKSGEELGTVLPEMAKRSESVHPQPIYDIATVMTLLHERADEWLIDTEKIILNGFSAGAHNVLNYTVHWNQPLLTDKFNVAHLKPAAVIPCYALTDYVFKATEPVNDPFGQALFKAGNIALFGTENPSHETLVELSPALNISEDTPPMFIWATAQDGLVSVGHSTRLATALADKGIPFELHIFEEGPHGLALGTQATAKAWPETNRDVAKWPELADAWLQKRFALPLDEKSRWA